MKKQNEERSIQSIGGKARAAKLSSEERRRIAANAAKARWSLPKSTHESESLRIADKEIPCAVLEDGTRILTSAGMLKALDRPWRGKYKRTEMPNFLAANNLIPFIDSDLRSVLEPIDYRSVNGGTKSGYNAELLPKACDVYLKARDAGKLKPGQEKVAKQCEIVMRALAHIGIISLVDEATGYQQVRDRDALQKILDKYLKDEWAKWTKRFPDEYYRELFRLKSMPYPPAGGTKKPQYVGHWTNDIVYSRLAPGVKRKLQELNPKNPRGHRPHKHHQHLTDDFGVPELQSHLSNLIFLMKGCTSWDDFKRRLDRAKPKFGDTPELPLDFGD